MNFKNLILFVGISFCEIAPSNAQITYADDVVIEGNLDVGTAAEKGNLKITGQTGNTASPGLTVTGDGGVVFGGTYGTGLIPPSSTGPHFLWYPKKSAFLAGRGLINDVEVGSDSIALGHSVKASGANSVAFGESVKASGAYSFAVGSMTEASGSHSIAIGDWCVSRDWASVAIGSDSAAEGEFSVALGYLAWATADRSIAIGEESVASGEGAVAIGPYVMATENASLALGLQTLSSGQASSAFGRETKALGDASTALGYRTSANSYASTVLGRYNADDGTNDGWVETDPLFVIGNGTGVATDPAGVKNRNAFVVYKNGDARFSKRQGDVLMGEFGNPE